MGDLIESSGHQTPGVPIIGHVGVLVAIQPARVKLLVDIGDNGDAGIGVLGEHDIAERRQGIPFRLGEEAPRGHVVEAFKHHAPGQVIPVFDLVKNVVVGVAAMHLRRLTATLTR